MSRARIVCIGNPYQPADWVGPAVHGILGTQALPDGIELIDGGLQGLNLLRVLDGTGRVIFADTLAGETAGACTVIDDPLAAADALRFDHAGGLGYLLLAARATQAALPRIRVVGASAGAPRATAQAVAARCLELADER